MARYIDAEKLDEHKFPCVAYDRYVSDGKRKSDDEIYAYKVGYNEAISNIEQFAPTADVRENVHGKWGYSLAGNWKCSVCGDEPYYDSRKGLNFCPNCGADMRERSEE